MYLSICGMSFSENHLFEPCLCFVCGSQGFVSGNSIVLCQVVVMGKNIVFGNDESKTEQIASLVSDYPLSNSECQISHPYSPQSELVCEYPLGKNLVSYVFFDKRTFVGAGDTICLYDGEKRKIGSYTGNELAGKRIQVKSNILKVLLKSDNDEHQGWGFAISKIERIPVSLLRLPFDAIRKTKVIP